MQRIAIPKEIHGENDKFAENLNNFRQSEKFCDYVLKTKNGEEFPVHKNVIAAKCSFFAAKFNNALFSDSNSSVSELENVSSEVLGKIIEFMYTANATIHPDYAKEMLDTALFLGLDDLVDACAEVLIETTNMQTCVDLLKYSETYHRCDKLINACLQYILKNMNALIVTPDFVKISSDSMKKIISIDRNRCSEETLFSAIIKWISFDLEKREEFIKPFIDCVHFDKLSNEFCLTNVFENNPLLNNFSFLKKLVDFQKKTCEMQVNSRRKRKAIQPLNFDNVCEKVDQTREYFYRNLFAVFNGGLRQFNKNSFSDSIAIIQQFDFGYSVINKQDLIVCGGYSNGTQTNICQYFSFNKLLWKNLSKMKVARDEHRLISIDDKVYACGGRNIKSVEIFDLNKNCWMDGPDLPQIMSDFGLCALNNCIYATHGKSVYRLDPRESSWRTLSTSLNSENIWCSSIGFENFIYRFEKENILKFDLRNNELNYEKEKNFGMQYLQTPHVCMMGNHIYVFGYYEDSVEQSKYLLQKYDASNMNLLDEYHMNTRNYSYAQALFSTE